MLLDSGSGDFTTPLSALESAVILCRKCGRMIMRSRVIVHYHLIVDLTVVVKTTFFCLVTRELEAMQERRRHTIKVMILTIPLPK